MSHSGYQPLSQVRADEDSEDEVDVAGESAPLVRVGRQRPGSIDLGKLDTAFRKWTESIAHKVKRKKKAPEHSGRRQIHHTVFGPQVVATAPSTVTAIHPDHTPPLTDSEFDAIAQSIRDAINEGIHPKLITKGSSGSYFARAKTEGGRVVTVAVFKPMNEEPYGNLNPKTMKWIHRQFRWLVPFGRACLIPNLSYISEAAASLLDTRLDLHIVPPTKLVSLSSPAFYYDWIDRTAAKKGKPLPEKIGSLQYFLHGFSDASDFLRKHPLPGRAIVDTFDDSTHRQGSVSKKFLNTCKVLCGKTGTEDNDYFFDEYEEDVTSQREESIMISNNGTTALTAGGVRPFYWTAALQASFRAELEKLVILDYLMLNTDRGADNYMIRYCEGGREKCLVDVAPSLAPKQPATMPLMSELRRTETAPPTTTTTTTMQPPSSIPSMASSSIPSMTPSVSFSQPKNGWHAPHINIAAIDNSLSFPHMHPNGWRSYTYGWLFLPVSVIGNPFSEATRNHFLPMLTSKTWWEETAFQLRQIHAVDAGFHPQMFAKQLAVLKGQAYNIVESLRHADEGPLELTRRSKVLVWDDLIEIADDQAINNNHTTPTSATNANSNTQQTGPLSASPKPSVNSVPLPAKRPRSHSSSATDFPPPMRRTSTDAFGAPRPVSFASKFQRGVHPGTTGVTVLEHLEKLDAVEASLHRLTDGGSESGAVEEETEEQEEEMDVGEMASSSSSKTVNVPRRHSPSASSSSSSRGVAGGVPTSPFSAPGSPLPTLHEVESREASAEPSDDGQHHGRHQDINGDEDDEDDEQALVAMSKSVSHVDPPRSSRRNHQRHGRWASNVNELPGELDWMEDSIPKRTVIVERLEPVDTTSPLCSSW